MFRNIFLYLIMILVIFLTGYIFGRRFGEIQGIKRGLSIAPLEIRKKTLVSDKCPICGRKLNKQASCDNILKR